MNKKCEALAQDVFFHGCTRRMTMDFTWIMVDTSVKVNEVKDLTLVSSIRVLSRSRFWHLMETSVCVLLSRFLGIQVFKIT